MMIEINEDIQNCLAVLRKGGTILYPTDTVWGLGCDATNPIAVENLLSIKERAAAQGLIMLISTENEIEMFTQQYDVNILNFLNRTEKPTTVIYNEGKNVAPAVLNADGSIAMRLTKDVFCKQLLLAFGKPLVSTSANIHGEPTPSFFKEISETLKSRVDYIVHYRRLDNEPRESSALVRWLGNGAIETIRK